MWKNLVALSLFVLSLSIFVHGIAPAIAKTGALSLGNNTSFSKSAFTTGDIETFPTVIGQDRIITDIYLAAQPNYEMEIVFTTSSGQELGRYKTWNYNGYSDGGLDTHLQTGLRVPEGEDMTVSINGRGVYTISGYLARP